MRRFGTTLAGAVQLHAPGADHAVRGPVGSARMASLRLLIGRTVTGLDVR